jgi:hypothetical protein
MKHFRFFYFLKDTVTDQFYTGENTNLGSFDKAAVYFQKKNAENKLKTIVNIKYSGSWPWLQKHWTNKKDKVKDQFDHVKICTKLVNERKNLVNWGIEIVEIKVSYDIV